MEIIEKFYGLIPYELSEGMLLYSGKEFYRIINLAERIKVLIEGIIKVEVIKLFEIDLRDIAINKIYVGQVCILFDISR